MTSITYIAEVTLPRRPRQFRGTVKCAVVTGNGEFPEDVKENAIQVIRSAGYNDAVSISLQPTNTVNFIKFVR